jgi:hypothetical protein
MTPEALVRRLNALYGEEEKAVKLRVLCACMAILATQGISKQEATRLLEDAGGHDKMTTGKPTSFAEIIWREVQDTRAVDRPEPVQMESLRVEEQVVAGFNVLHL